MFRAFAKGRKLALDHAERLTALRGSGRGLFAKKKDSGGELFIYETIGASFWGGGVTAKDVADKLGTLKGSKSLDVYINSEGGDVFEGKAIYNLLRRFDGQVTVHIDGIAASAASFIAMAAAPGRLVMAENATMMIHEAWGMAMGNAGDMRALADVLDSENKSIAGIYAARTAQPAESFWTRPPPSAADSSPKATGLMADETWLNAADALEMKLTDAVEKNAAPADESADEKAAASIPAFMLAKETQRRIAMARARLVETEHSVLQDRRRASPERNPQSRPAART